MRWYYLLLTVFVSSGFAHSAESPREFNKLIGTWKGAGTPEGGTPEARQKGHWTESAEIVWKFSRDESWLDFKFKDGKFFAEAALAPTKDKKWTFKSITPEKTLVEYSGTWDGKQFQLTRTLKESSLEERLIISPLHENRFTYRLETRKLNSTLWTKTYQVGLTKQGVAFAETGDGERECIVSGGRGTSTVTFEGKTYYVCCSGCRDEFKEDPKKYIALWEAKRKKK